VFAADAALGHYVSHQPSTPEPAITSILAKFTPEPVWRSPRNLLVAMLSQRMSPPHSLDRAACRRYTFGLTYTSRPVPAASGGRAVQVAAHRVHRQSAQLTARLDSQL